MGHLIGAIRGGDVRTSRKDLVAVHDYLVENARLALGRALREPAEAFGAGVKRQQVELAAVRRPTLVQAGERHNLMEVVNQCATLERLLDALAWIERTPRFDGAVIQVCHPSTSSDRTRSRGGEQRRG